MAGGHVFISHSSHDDEVVRQLRTALEGLGVKTWVDSRRLSGGDPLAESIRRHAIGQAEHVLAVLGPQTVNSTWVADEICWSLAEAEARDGLKVIAVLLPGIEPTALRLWFGNAQPVAVRVGDGPGAMTAALPALLAALGRRLPDDFQASLQPTAPPIAELVLKLSDPAMEESDGKRRATAKAKLIYVPAEVGERTIESRRFRFTAPLGPIERGELEWYLERYHRWPSDVFRQRAREVESSLPGWGKQLHTTLTEATGREAFEAWKAGGDSAARRFSVLVDADPVAGSSEEEQAAAAEGATQLLSLPWELAHDGKRYLFQGGEGVQVRRRLPNRDRVAPLVTAAPIRVLLASPRPEDDRAAYIDHRVSARPLVEALEPLGELVELTILSPPTKGALATELKRAREAGRPYHVVHFDGHGVYDKQHGLGGLCFEDPRDDKKLQGRRSEIVMADELAAMVQDHRVPLVFLEACQTAKAEEDAHASVAGRLLQGGVASVLAMSHSVLVETARRFVAVFYRELMAGRRIGDAVLEGRVALKDDTWRGKVFKADLHLEDWFVPVLFQEELDPQLITAVPADAVRRVEEERQRLALGELPEAPEHSFVGRSRELLSAERLLARERYLVLRGESGEGKTTLAAELARWLVATRRFRRAAFVSLEVALDARRVLWALGGQLVPGFESEAARDEENGLRLVERALADEPTLIVLDNMESVLAPQEGSVAASAFEPEVLDEVLELCGALGRVGPTRLVFTSREPLPEPFGHKDNVVGIERLDRFDAIELVGRVLGEGNLMPHADDEGESEEEIEKLVDAVNRHARSLVLLAGEVVASGVRHATEHLHELMAALAEKYPDDRERSLLANVELSLRRLPEETRRLIRPLGVFQGGGHLANIAVVLGLGSSLDEAKLVAQQLIDVGLAHMMPYGYLRLHPALRIALSGELRVEDRERAREIWAETTVQFARFLRDQQTKDYQLAAALTVVDLPNLLAGLEYLRTDVGGERVVSVATRLEDLLQRLDRPRAMARVAEIREVASRALGEWGHARFLSESAAVDRLFDAGRFAEAAAAARQVLERGMAAGEDAYRGAAYDLASAHFKLGRCLSERGSSDAALAPLGVAEKRFRRLASDDSGAAARMVILCLSESAPCLMELGRFDEAAKACETAIAASKDRRNFRQVAVDSMNLGTVRYFQRQYGDALSTMTEAQQIFEQLGDLKSAAAAWHQIGSVYHEAQQLEAAERAYQNALKISVQLNDRQREAMTLGQLGNLCSAMGRRGDAVGFHQQASAVFVELGDTKNEGLTRSNAAVDLLELKRCSEARREILRAIECKIPFGHAAEPWASFKCLYDLERASGNDDAAAEAHGQAVQAYLEYRRAGGESRYSGGQLAVAVGQAISTGEVEEVEAEFARWLEDPDLPNYPSLEMVVDKLQAILSGSRDPALASDPELTYDDAAEILLLLEQLAEKAED